MVCPQLGGRCSWFRKLINMAHDDLHPVTGMLRGLAGETRHVCWECPECHHGYSDDYDDDLPNPYKCSCGRTRHHALGQQIHVSISWSSEADNKTPRELGYRWPAEWEPHAATW